MCISMWIMWITKRKPVCMGSSDVDNFWGIKGDAGKSGGSGSGGDPPSPGALSTFLVEKYIA